MEQGQRNYATISPSAKWVLLMKGHTAIPYARQTAEYISQPEAFDPRYNEGNMRFWGRTLHFEARYRSIDLLLQNEPMDNILELSGGYSLRGLNYIQQQAVHYIDTDLPDMVEQKKALINALDTDAKERKGQLEILPLNVLDEPAFLQVADHFPPGPVAIVNEGLLVYLDTKEKEQLCAIIRKVLQQRGGYWITADIYLKFAQLGIDMTLDEETQQFFKEQNVEENRFESFDAAKAFFEGQGFIIDKEAEVDPTTLSAFQPFLNTIPQEQWGSLKDMPKFNATWRLKLV